jgi:hypothetical protein
MSLSLAELQAKFQHGVLSSDDDLLGLIRKPPNDTPQVMFGVYRNAYVLRLIEFLANDHEKLKAYLGDEQFGEMARSYVKAHPSDQPNARWYSRHLPEFLARHETYSRHAELAEMAALEKALNDSFDAPDVEVLSVNDLVHVDPNAFDKARFGFHPSAIRLQFNTNVIDIWSALKAEEAPPQPATSETPAEILVWRQSSASRFRQLNAEETMAFDEARNGVPFGVLCEMIAMMDDPDNAALRAATYLRGWIESELICKIET